MTLPEKAANELRAALSRAHPDRVLLSRETVQAVVDAMGEEDVGEIAACEAPRIVLRPGRLYRTYVVEGCDECEAAVYEEFPDDEYEVRPPGSHRAVDVIHQLTDDSSQEEPSSVDREALHEVENLAAAIAYRAGLGASEWEGCMPEAIEAVRALSSRVLAAPAPADVDWTASPDSAPDRDRCDRCGHPRDDHDRKDGSCRHKTIHIAHERRCACADFVAPDRDRRAMDVIRSWATEEDGFIVAYDEYGDKIELWPAYGTEGVVYRDPADALLAWDETRRDESDG